LFQWPRLLVNCQPQEINKAFPFGRLKIAKLSAIEVICDWTTIAWSGERPIANKINQSQAPTTVTIISSASNIEILYATLGS